MVNTVQLSGMAAFAATAAQAYISTGSKPFSQQALDMFNPLKNQGGAGPYSTHTGYGISRFPPPQCKVDQAQVIMRHGERYPTAGFAKRTNKILKRIKENNITASGDLTFLNTYKSPAMDEENYEMESFKGPYSGMASMVQTGADLREYYGHLWDENTTLPIFAGDDYRVVVTAVNAARGFLGANWTKKAEFVVIKESAEAGLNSLTPVDGCPAFDDEYHDKIEEEAATILLEPLVKRFNKELPGVNVTAYDLVNFFMLAMYDLNVQGTSPWFNYFTGDDWAAFAYYRDIHYYYHSSEGNPLSNAIGSVTAKAFLDILESPADPTNATALYLSFSHDNDMLRHLVPFGYFNPNKDLDAKNPDYTTRYKTSQISPMGARFAFERLSCQNLTDPSVTEHFVRFVANDAVIPHQSCTSGPGLSCPLDEFVDLTRAKLEDPVAKCGINSTYTAPKNLTFYWDYKTNSELYKNEVLDITQY